MEESYHTKLKLFKYISQDLDNTQLSYINQLNTSATIVSDVKSSYGEEDKVSNEHQQEMQKLMSLLKFAPQPMIGRIIKKLEEIQKIALSEI